MEDIPIVTACEAHDSLFGRPPKIITTQILQNNRDWLNSTLNCNTYQKHGGEQLI